MRRKQEVTFFSNFYDFFQRNAQNEHKIGRSFLYVYPSVHQHILPPITTELISINFWYWWGKGVGYTLIFRFSVWFSQFVSFCQLFC